MFLSPLDVGVYCKHLATQEATIKSIIIPARRVPFNLVLYVFVYMQALV